MGVVRVYHVTPRFLVAALGRAPSQLRLDPGTTKNGEFVQWTGGNNYSLSAPIVEVSLNQLVDRDAMDALRAVFAHWVRLDRENCDLARQGLLRFRMPAGYRTNEMPDTGVGEMGSNQLEPEFLHRGLRTLAEGIQCIGGQLFDTGDRQGAIWAALLLEHLLTSYKLAFAADFRWTLSRVRGGLGSVSMRFSTRASAPILLVARIKASTCSSSNSAIAT